MKISFKNLKVIKMEKCKECICSYWNKLQKKHMCGKYKKEVVLSEDTCIEFVQTNWK